MWLQSDTLSWFRANPGRTTLEASTLTITPPIHLILTIMSVKVLILSLSTSILYLLYVFYAGPLWSWSYGSWIYSYLCKQCLSPLPLWVWIIIRRGVLDITWCDKICQWSATDPWFSLGTLVSSTNKTDRNNIAEILLKVALNTINLASTFPYLSIWFI